MRLRARLTCRTKLAKLVDMALGSSTSATKLQSRGGEAVGALEGHVRARGSGCLAAAPAMQRSTHRSGSWMTKLVPAGAHPMT